MENVKHLLFNKKNEINILFEGLLSTFKDIIDKKNKEIVLLKKEKEALNIENSNITNNKNKLDVLKVIINELSTRKKNNNFFKKIIEVEIENNKIKFDYNNKVNQIKSEYNEKLNSNEGKINTEDMEAYKIIAVKLQEKEEINKNCLSTIDELKNENKTLKENISTFTKENEELKSKVNTLSEENTNLSNLNESRLSIIESLGNKLKSKTEKLTDLKSYFGITITGMAFNELVNLKKNNRLLRRILKTKIKNIKIITKYKEKINKIKSEYKEKLINIENNKLSAENMEAYKIIAVKLQEKEEINKNCLSTIDELKNENKNLKIDIDLFRKENENLKNKVIVLDEKNLSLLNLNKSQLNTIETLTREMKSKSEKISDLKNYFLEILDNYNDIIQEVE